MGTTPRAIWPLPAQNETDEPAKKAKPAEETLSRITLALLDEYSTDERKRGYNPYDRPTAGGRDADIWRRKPKRD